MALHSANSNYSFEEDKLLGSLEDRFPFLKDDRKRTRKLLSPEQTRVLEAILEKTVYPSTPLREAVARQLGIPPRKVQIWFQNKRQGRRRMPSNAAATASSFSTHGHLVGQDRHRRGGDQFHLRIHDYHQTSMGRDGRHLQPHAAHLAHHQQQPRHISGYRTLAPPHYPSSGGGRGVVPTVVRPRANSELSTVAATLRPGPGHTVSYPSLPHSEPIRRSFCKPCDGKIDPTSREDEQVSPTASVSLHAFTRQFQSATNLETPPVQLLPTPKHQQPNPNSGRHSMASWSPTNNYHERPAALTLEERSQKSSSESMYAGSNGFGRDEWSGRSSPPSSSSSMAPLTDAMGANRGEKPRERIQQSASPPLSGRGVQEVHLQLAPIQTADYGPAVLKRCEVLPSISELIRN